MLSLHQPYLGVETSSLNPLRQESDSTNISLLSIHEISIKIEKLQSAIQ